MMPGDTFLQANQLLKALPHSDVSFEVAPLAWRFESQRLAEAFNAYRRRQRRLRTQLRNLRLELEDKALELLSKSVRQAHFNEFYQVLSLSIKVEKTMSKTMIYIIYI